MKSAMIWCQSRTLGADRMVARNTMDSAQRSPEITEEERINRFVLHLSSIVHQGGEVVERWKYTAIVLRTTRASFTPNVIMIVAGLALFALTKEPLFALAAFVAAMGWHRKILDATNPKRLLVRIDEHGHVREIEQPGS